MKKRTSLLVATCMLLCTVPLASAKQVNPNATKVTVVAGAAGPASGTTVFNEATEAPDIVGDTRFTGNQIETAVLTVRDELVTLKNSVKTMEFKKANPIKGDLQNFDVGAHKDITDLMKEVSTLLGADQDRFSEKDPVAIPMIPIGDTGYKLPLDTQINVIGGSAIQAYPLMVGDELIGHFRAVCGGYDEDDVIVNNESVSYCVTSIMTTGVTRSSDVHKSATTRLYFVGVSDPYMVGKVAKVNINWVNQPKSTIQGTLEHYHLEQVPNAVAALDYNAILTMADGTRLAGVNPEVDDGKK